MSEQKKLLCTFSSLETYKNIVDKIRNNYILNNNKIFIFSNIKNKKEIFVTYNVIIKEKFIKFPNTILIHRKRETNTFFTLNSMNQLIKDENGGVFDNSYIIDWELYKNSIILIGDPIKIISIELEEILY